MFEGYNIHDELERRKRDTGIALGAVQPDVRPEVVLPVTPAETPDSSETPDYEGMASEARDRVNAEYERQKEDANRSFLELLMQNAAMQQAEAEREGKKEKERRARIVMASLADGLSALGNLVGTSHGAMNQPQTYQLPFVKQDVEQDRALARATAERLRATDQDLRMAQLKLNAGVSPTGLEDVKHYNRLAEIYARGENAENVQQHIDQRHASGIASREGIAADRNATNVEVANIRAGVSAQNNIRNNETRKYVAEIKSPSTRGLTSNAKAKWIHDNAMTHLDELEQELIQRYGSKYDIPSDWRMNWRQYVGDGPFYQKYYKAYGWEDLVDQADVSERSGNGSNGGKVQFSVPGSGKKGGKKANL